MLTSLYPNDSTPLNSYLCGSTKRGSIVYRSNAMQFNPGLVHSHLFREGIFSYWEGMSSIATDGQGGIRQFYTPSDSFLPAARMHNHHMGIHIALTAIPVFLIMLSDSLACLRPFLRSALNRSQWKSVNSNRNQSLPKIQRLNQIKLNLHSSIPLSFILPSLNKNKIKIINMPLTTRIPNSQNPNKTSHLIYSFLQLKWKQNILLSIAKLLILLLLLSILDQVI